MNLWLLSPIGNTDDTFGFLRGSPWFNRYDRYHGFLIRAETEQNARSIAATGAAGEGPDAWINPIHSTCVTVPLDGQEGVIISDFQAG